MGKLNWSTVKKIRANYDKNVESKHSYCLKVAKEHNISEGMARQVLDNKKWYDKDYEPYLPGRNKLTEFDIYYIRQNFLNKDKDELVTEFIERWSYLKEVSKSQISNIIYNKIWVDKTYEVPKVFSNNIKTYYIK